MSYYLESVKVSSCVFNKIVVASNASTKKVEAIGLIKCESDLIKIAYLATHPKNITSSVNARSIERVKGTGAAIVKAVARLACNTKKKYIYVDSVSSARPFYARVGFKSLDPFSEDETVTMRLRSIL